MDTSTPLRGEEQRSSVRPRNARDARLITGEARLDIRVPRPPDFVPDNPPAAAEPRAPVVGDEPLARRGFNRLGPPSSWGRRRRS